SRDRAISPNIFDKIQVQITHNYNNLVDFTTIKEMSFKKVIKFMDNYLSFSEYISSKSGKGKFSISNMKVKEGSIELEHRSLLYENLRYIFPRKFGLPIDNSLLSWFLYGDSPEYGKSAKMLKMIQSKSILRRFNILELLSIDYRISRLTKNDFEKQKIRVTEDQLLKIQDSVSYIIYSYIFGDSHDSLYVSDATQYGLKVGKYYFTPEYFVIRALFFSAAEVNNGIPLDFASIGEISGVVNLLDHLTRGVGFGDIHFKALFDYAKGLLDKAPISSDRETIRAAKHALEKYKDISEFRRKEFLDSREFKSAFQGRVYYFMNDFFGLEFFSEKQVSSAVNSKEIIAKNDEGDLETIKIHLQFSFDGYLELTRALKVYLGLDDKWIGIAFEAQGTYWHSRPEQMERDRKKRLICQEKNVILLEIWDKWDEVSWMNKVLEQLKGQTGIDIKQEKLNELKKYLGDI
ncbi:hypothetical protein LCGC14_1952320, partial [marine sediment metagenome]